MSFGVRLYRLDPWGFVDPDGFSAEDRQAVCDVLMSWGWDGTEQMSLRTPDGLHVEFHGKLLRGGFDGVKFRVSGASEDLWRLILETAKSGGLCIFSDANEAVPILIDRAQRRDLPAELASNPNLKVITSPAELLRALGG
jgi:hypothetical protein